MIKLEPQMHTCLTKVLICTLLNTIYSSAKYEKHIIGAHTSYFQCNHTQHLMVVLDAAPLFTPLDLCFYTKQNTEDK